MSSLYPTLLAEGEDPDGPARVIVERDADHAIVTLSEPERLNVLSARSCASSDGRSRS